MFQKKLEKFETGWGANYYFRKIEEKNPPYLYCPITYSTYNPVPHIKNSQTAISHH